MQSEEGRKVDELHEIARMEEVYANASINICAAAATWPMDGCFLPREPIPITHIKYHSVSRSMTKEYLLYNQSRVEKAYSDFRDPEINPEFGRAWCLQERFLCPRMVHFGRSGIFWECNEDPLASDLLPIPHEKIPIPAFSFSASADSVLWSAYSLYANEWRRIISEYTNMGLTHPTKDKLAACSGIAKRTAGLMKDEYVAGFFRWDLIASTTWIRAAVKGSGKLATRRAKEWRAPSWYVRQDWCRLYFF